MEIDIKKWLLEALENSGYSQAALARDVEKKIGRSFPQVTLYKILKDIREIKFDEMLAIEALTNYPLPRKKTLPLSGYVGAGAEIIPYETGCLEEVDAPPYLSGTSCVVKVRGDSMEPFIQDGALLFYSKTLPARELLNKKAIVHLEDGRCFVKILRPGSSSSTFTLESINRLYPDIKDVVVLWGAVIDWIKPPAF